MRFAPLAALAVVAVTLLAVVTGQTAFADVPAPLNEAGSPSEAQSRAKIAHELSYFLEDTGPLRVSRAVVGASSTELRPQAAALVRDGVVDMDAANRVQLVVRAGCETETTIAAIEALGGKIERIDRSDKSIQTSVDPAIIPSIATLDAVTSIETPVYGHVNAGSKTTQGDALLNLDDMRAALGVNGTGVTVGVISDGINGLQSSILLGDLPATQEIRNAQGRVATTTGGVIGRSFRSDRNLEGGLGGATTGAEGTAMLEIIHDIAPGAQLMFANFQTASEFNAAVDWLAANADVVVDDISFFGIAYDQSSHVSVNTATELNRPGNRVRAYFTSAGNYAQRHWEGMFESGGTCHTDAFTTCQQFTPSADTTDFQGLGGQPFNRIRILRNQSATIYLSWSETYGAATSNYNLYLVDETTLSVVASSQADNIGGNPTEQISFVNLSGSDRWYRIRITNTDSYPARNMDLFVLGGVQQADGNRLNFNTRKGSVPAQSDAGGGVISVGAINSSDIGTDTIAPYSSWGPANNGAQKPDATAIDCVQVTGSGGFGSNFCGTSAAAPHGAAMAALVLQKRPDLMAGGQGEDPAAERAALRAVIVGSAVDLGEPGTDYVFGAGRIDGLAAGSAATSAEPPVVPSASAWGLAIAAAALATLAAVRTRRPGSKSL